jgi:hypothetical protein
MFGLPDTHGAVMNVITTIHFLFRINFVILSEAHLLSEEKSETFPRAFMVAERFLFEKIIVAYLVEYFSAFIKKEKSIPYYFLFLGRGKIMFVGTPSSHGPIFQPPDDG